MSWYLFLVFILWWWLGYLVFYFRYQHRDTVNELRSNLKEAGKEVQYLSGELDEYVQQNALLKQKVTELLDKNDDLGDVVSELSKYYVHLKKAAEKSTELNKFLQTPNPNIEEKMEQYIKPDLSVSSKEKTFF